MLFRHNNFTLAYRVIDVLLETKLARENEDQDSLYQELGCKIFSTILSPQIPLIILY